MSFPSLNSSKRRQFNWIVNASDLAPFLRLFYACAFLRLAFGLAPDFMNRNLAHVSYLWPLSWIPLFPSEIAEKIPYALVFFTGIFLGLATLFPSQRLYRVLGSFFLLLVLALRFSFGEVGHSNFMWGLCAIFVCWCKVEDSDFWKKMNAAWIQGACALLCSFYLLASLYKIESYFRVLSLGQDWYSTLANFLPIQLWHAYYFGELSQPPPTIFQDPSAITAFLVVAVLGFQLSALVPFFQPRFYRLWSVFFILFHAANVYILETNFQSAVLMIVVLMGLHPLKEESVALR